MSFPDPPLYVKFYTADAVNSGTAPPPPPVPKQFKVFGEENDLDAPYIPELTSLGITQVYSKCTSMEEYKAELKKISSSIMITFLDLVNILTRNPLSEERNEQFETLKTLFINMHHVINECRVVQARVTLASIQKEQNRQMETLLKTFGSAKINAIKHLKEAIALKEDYDKEEEEHKWDGEEYAPSDYDQEEDPMVMELDSHRHPSEEAKVQTIPLSRDEQEEIIAYMKKKEMKRTRVKDSVIRLVDEKQSIPNDDKSNTVDFYKKIKECLKRSQNDIKNEYSIT